MTAASEQTLVPLADPDEIEHFRVMIDMRTRHADLWPLVRRLGSTKALCREIGMPMCHQQTVVGKWVNLKAVPSRLPGSLQAAAIEALFVLTGKTFDELWPLALRQAIQQGRAAQRKEVLLNTSTIELGERARERLILPDPSQVAEDEEIHALLSGELDGVLNHLSYRERKVLKCRYGLGEHDGQGHTLAETGRIFRVSTERIRQIERRALEKLRKKAKQLPVLRDLTPREE